MPATVLIIEDSQAQALIYESYLRDGPYRLVVERDGREAFATLRQFCPSVVLLDLHLPGMDGMSILREVRRMYPRLPVIVATGDSSAKVAAQAMSEGAFDFIVKPFSETRLRVTLQNALDTLALECEVIEWRKVLGQHACHGFIGQSPPMQAVYRVIDSVASSKASVFITGEGGTGKNLAVRAIHDASPRRAYPLITFNCSAFPKDFLDNALFGRQGSQADQDDAEPLGALKQADKGTLFLEDIAALSNDTQSKLFRFLQSGDLSSIGLMRSGALDVRVLASTSRSPEEEVHTGRLREDLYYSLHVVALDLPALRDREDDLVLLSEFFLEKFSAEEKKNFDSFEPEVMAVFRAYDWPGNVRQLENVIRTVVVLNQGPTVRLDMLPDTLKPPQGQAVLVRLAPKASPANAAAKLDRGAIKPLWKVEKEAVLSALAYAGQDVSKAAALLEISPSALYRKLHILKINEVSLAACPSSGGLS